MDYFRARIHIKDAELNQIFDKLHAAIEVINESYYALEQLGVLVVEKEEATSGN